MKNKIHIEFLGAQDTVTGSRTLIKFKGKEYLIDCGLFQGTKELRQRNWNSFPIDPNQIDAVFLTHAHLDHSGYLPKLVKSGYKGPIYCSHGTQDLLDILLLDAAYLEEESAKYANASGYSHHKPALPLFTSTDAKQVFPLVRPLESDEWHEIDEDLSVRLFRAGHIIGSRVIQFSFNIHNNHRTRITFSGDLGNRRSKIMRGPVTLPETDYLFLESTYGDRLHPRNDALDELESRINEIIETRGVLLIPSFAIGRAQELIYLIRLLESENRIPKIPVYLDSPMAKKATEVFLNHEEDHILGSSFLGEDLKHFFPEKFVAVSSVDESMSLCVKPGPIIIISAAGMLSGGRILHHLKTRLPDKRNILLFSGYQAEGTKGRYLQDNYGKTESLRIHHLEVPIGCKVEILDELSAHADYQDILDWLDQAPNKPGKIYINHGSKSSQEALAKRIKSKFDIDAIPAVQQKNIIIET